MVGSRTEPANAGRLTSRSGVGRPVGAPNWRFPRRRLPVTPGRGVWGPPISRPRRQTPRPGDASVQDPPRPGDCPGKTPRPGDGYAPLAHTWRLRRPHLGLAGTNQGLFPEVGAHIWQIEIFMSFSHTKCLVGGLPISRACREGLGSPGLGTHIWRLAPEGPLQSPGLGAQGPPIYRSGRRTPRPGDANVQDPPRPGDADG